MAGGGWHNGCPMGGRGVMVLCGYRGCGLIEYRGGWLYIEGGVWYDGWYMGHVNDIEVYLKHKATSAEWELMHPLFRDIKPCMGLGEYMIRHMDSSIIDYSVRRDIEKFNSIDRYYVRHFIKGNAFINNFNMPLSQSIIDTVWRVYNYDPWNRQFPYWLENCESDYYRGLGKYETRVRYGYWVFYRDRVIGCNKNNQNNYTASIFNKLPRNVIPCCVLSSTSVEGVTVACLDVIEG